MKNIISGILFALLVVFTHAAYGQDVRLNSLFSDHMVLQQESSVPIWGNARSGSDITVASGWGQTGNAVADEQGKWRVELNTPSAGGPFQITVTSKSESVVLNDVLIGEVWLCSGQSNMEMPLNGFPPGELIMSGQETIENAIYPELRMFTVKRNTAFEPQPEVAGDWIVCSPQTAGQFSAVAFYFGMKLHQELGVPVGLIHSSWGGTPAESWAPVDFLEKMVDFKNVRDQLSQIRENGEQLTAWLNSHEKVVVDEPWHADCWKGLDFSDERLAAADFDDSTWLLMNLPSSWSDSDLRGFDGVVWCRTKFHVPDTWPGKPMVMELPPIDDMDRVYLNGRLVGATESLGFWQTKRRYTFFGDMLVPGENTIAIRIVDSGGGGGFYGKASEMRLFPETSVEKAVSLSGEWKYLPVAEYRNNTFYLIGTTLEAYAQRPPHNNILPSNTFASLYNGMIAPLVPFSIKGAIWYQGEANVGRAAQYNELFPGLIGSWRAAWKYDFPFYFVQIAPWRYSGANNSESAELRFSQFQALALPKTGIAVTLDIGSIESIHPPNKKEVGDRLARWALAKDYGRINVPYAGPLCTSALQKNNQIILEFDSGAEKLEGSEDIISGFELVTAEGKVIPVDANVGDNTVTLSVPDSVKPEQVRYAWKNGSNATLFNSAGLPASTFRIEVH